MIRKIALVLSGLVLVLVVIGLATYLLTAPELLPAESNSAAWLNPGPHAVAEAELVFIDSSRSTNENNGEPGSPTRVFPTTVWYPRDTDGSHPLILHSHGFVSSRTELSYLAELLASNGYVVVAADFPLSSGSAPGGANANDLVNQPADVSFLIDSMLELSAQDKPFDGEIDIDRIGLTGLSLGGLTTSLATYHPRLRDKRVKAAVSIAGPTAMLSKRFYETTDIPFLMIAGTADGLIDHASNAAIIPERIDNGVLLTIAGGSHVGFVGLTEPFLRLMHNPDSLGCSAVMANLDEDSNQAITDLGTEEDGIYIDPNVPGVCTVLPLAKAAHPARQQMITQVGVLSFFESVFAEDEATRKAAYEQLSRFTSEDFAEASFTF